MQKNNHNFSDRKQVEAEFHDKVRRGVQDNDPNFRGFVSRRKFYSITRKSVNFFYNFISSHCKDKKVLDYCCGEGDVAFFAAKNGGNVVGIDISPESIKIAENGAKERGLSDKAKFEVMDAENLSFEANSFDLIICGGVLHHLDIEKAYKELARVLKVDGQIICAEPLIHNPLFQLYRRLTPNIRTEWELDHILKRSQINLANKYFDRVEKNFFHLFSLLAVPFRKTFLFKPLLAVLELFDSAVFVLPGIKWWAWQIVFILSNPKK